MTQRMRTVIGTFVAACLILVGCSGTGDDSVSLSVGYTAELDGLDPSTVDGAAISMVMLYNVYETLVKDDGDGNIQPLLAREWDISDDNRTYTFHLEPEARFATGEPLTAEEVVASIDYVLGGQGAEAPVRNLLVRQMSVVETVTAVDEHTVEVELSRPSNQWLYDMTGPAGIIYDPAGMGTLNTAPMGSGPYQFSDWDSGAQLVLERNENYWGAAPEVDEIVWRVFADPNAMTSAMLAGQLDVISNLTTPEAVGEFEDPERFTVLEGYSNGEVVLGYNHTNEALSDVRVRQAITHAIDRQGLVDSIWGGQGSLIGSMVPPQDPWYEDLSEVYPYDPDRARELLADAGYADGLTLRLRVPALPYATSGARYLDSQLADVGITVQVDELEFPAVWLDEVFAQASYDLTIVSHVEPRDMAIFADPDYYWRYDNPEYQQLVALADEGTPEDQVRYLQEAARLLTEDAAATWLFLLPNTIITTSEVSGISANATNLSFDLTQVRLDS